MFQKRKQQAKMMQMLQYIKPTSKATLKQYCLIATNCDIDKAERLYTFLIKDMEDLPNSDPVQLSAMDNIKGTAADIFSFIKENQESIEKGMNFLRAVFGKGGNIVNSTNNALQPIN